MNSHKTARQLCNFVVTRLNGNSRSFISQLVKDDIGLNA